MTTIKNEHLTTVLPGQWTVRFEEAGKRGYHWTACYAGAFGTLMAQVSLLSAGSPAERLQLLERIVDTRRVMLNDLAGGRSAQSEAACAANDEIAAARFCAGDPKAHLAIVVEVRVHANKAVILQYMERAAVGSQARMDTRGQAILDAIETF